MRKRNIPPRCKKIRRGHKDYLFVKILAKMIFTSRVRASAKLLALNAEEFLI